MSYVDGFIAAVPTAHREAYRRHAQETAGVFKEHGALSVVECWPGTPAGSRPWKTRA